jgi:hypothetical protein
VARPEKRNGLVTPQSSRKRRRPESDDNADPDAVILPASEHAQQEGLDIASDIQVRRKRIRH